MVWNTKLFMRNHNNEQFLVLAHFLRIHRPLVDSPHKGPVMLVCDVLFIDLNKLLNKQLSYYGLEHQAVHMKS